MGIAKKLLKPRVIVWASVTVLLTGVLIAADYFAMNKYVSLIEATSLGGDTPIPDPNSKGNDKFVPDYATKNEAFNHANQVTKEICEEGMILLKNDNNALPIKSGAKVSVFGRNSTELVYGGSGSAAPDKNGMRKTIFNSLDEAGIKYNKTLADFYKKQSHRSDNPGMENASGEQKNAVLDTGETAYSKYTDKVIKSYDSYNDAALVVISRIAGEGWDLPRVAADNANRHYLELDNNERELIRQIAATKKFKRIVLLLNGSNYIDLGFLYERTNATDYNDFGKYIDAVVNIGSPGANGIMALGEILTGKVNPSGHTVDTVYTSYEKDPTWQNMCGNISYLTPTGSDAYINAASNTTGYFTVDYEENIYLGYRYYETRGLIEGEDWYNKSVIYPFGYGLSYTTFEQELVNAAALQAEALEYGKEFNVEIKVKNTGDVAGKQVVQLYVSTPYTNGIEKAHKVLVGFAKTSLLEKGAEETVTIKVNPYDFASFDSQDKNGNSFKGYELEAGEYTFYASTDAHHSFGEFKKNLAEGVKIENDPVTNTKVEPLFPEVTEHMNPAQSLSRSDFNGTFPQMITDAERTIDNDFLNKLKSKESTNDETYDTIPTMGAKYTVTLKDLINKEYDDELWDKFLDQLTFDDYLKLFNDGCYSTAAITKDVTLKEIDPKTGEEVEKLHKNYVIVPKTTSADGPTGIVGFLGDPAIYGCCYYCSECLVAQTFNLEMAAKQAAAIGNECLIGDEKHGGIGYPGWYAPGVNLHRSPFSGRNTEYYSEDPFLTGKFAATVIKGVKEKGVYANVKHFAVNDQETHRSAKGVATWVDEQAMRELYLKAFEIAVKESEANGLMTSFNRIGTEWAGGSYRLVTTILRKEWGFVGSVICDFHTDFYMDSKQMLYAGGDVNLCSDAEKKLITSNKYSTPFVKANNAKDVNLLRKAAHNTLYALANSCALKVDILRYDIAWWKIAFRAVEIGIPCCLAVWGFFAIFTALRKKEEVAEAAAE